MVRSSAGNKVALASGLGVLVVTLLAAVEWKHFAARYYLALLAEDPGKLRTFLEKPERDPRRGATRLFVESDEGKRTLFLLLWEAGLLGAFEENPFLPPPGQTWVTRDKVDSGAFSSEALPGLVEISPSLRGAEFSIPRHAVFRFGILEVRSAGRSTLDITWCVTRLADGRGLHRLKPVGSRPPKGG